MDDRNALHTPDILWGGRERACPRCGHRFKSRFDKGCCTRCNFLFDAMAVHGAPPDADVPAAEALARSNREARDHQVRQRYLNNPSVQLSVVQEIPLPGPTDGIPLWRRDWEADRLELLKTLDEASVLYRWVCEGVHSRDAGYLVVKAGLVTGLITTEVFRSDPAWRFREPDRAGPPGCEA